MSHSRSYSASPTPPDRKATRKKSFIKSFKKMSLFPRAEKSEEPLIYTGNISFLGQIYQNVRNKMPISDSVTSTSTYNNAMSEEKK